ncbi:MAG: NAD(P)H-dependent oxidoreductase [Oscillospiraceae bacterium]|nr:NAD(P)H-dependent oxidoreductase [Oscillospiraceae bacterium]
MKKMLVAYFSATGVTAAAAKNLAEAAGADLYEIRPKVPYTHDDLNWQNKRSRSSVEMSDRSSRPALADQKADIASYDVIFLGFPMWWYIAPTIVNTFLESYDFFGKTIVLFATSGGSGLGDTAKYLKPSVAPSTNLIEGKVLNGRPSVDALKEWVASLPL